MALNWVQQIWRTLTSDMQHQLAASKACVETSRLYSGGMGISMWLQPAAVRHVPAAFQVQAGNRAWLVSACLPAQVLPPHLHSSAAAAAAATQELEVDTHPERCAPCVGAGAPHLRHNLVHAELHQPTLCICNRPCCECPAICIALIGRAALPALAARPAAAAAGGCHQRAAAGGAAAWGARCRAAGDAEPAELPLWSWPAGRVGPRCCRQLQVAAAATTMCGAAPPAATAADFEGWAAGGHPEGGAAPVGVHCCQPLRIGLPPLLQRGGALEGEAHVCAGVEGRAGVPTTRRV